MMCATAKTNFSKKWRNQTWVAVPNSSEFQLVGNLVIFGQAFFAEKFKKQIMEIGKNGSILDGRGLKNINRPYLIDGPYLNFGPYKYSFGVMRHV